MSLLLPVGLVAMLAVASTAGGRLLAAGILIIQLIFTLGAVRLAPVPVSARAGWLALAGGATATGWMAVVQIPELSPLAKVLGPVFLLAVLNQLARHNGRGGLNASLALTGAAALLAVLSAAWVGLRFADGGVFAVALGLAGVGIAVLAESLPISATLRRLLAVLVAGGVAAGLVLVLGEMAAAVPAVGAVVIAAFGAVVAAVAAAAVDRLAEDAVRDLVGRPRPMTSPELTAERAVASSVVALRATLPVIAAGPVVYVLGRILVG